MSLGCSTLTGSETVAFFFFFSVTTVWSGALDSNQYLMNNDGDFAPPPFVPKAALDFCESRGGSLVDESNPALQGFLSWELWRRHKVRKDEQTVIY